MFKMIIISSFSLLLVIGCHKSSIDEGSNNIPEWLQDKIELMSKNQLFVGTKIYRYHWNEEYVYDIQIPSSSCLYCDLYYQSGKKIRIVNDAQYRQFLGSIKNELLLWKWVNKL